jgi:hypothetical protein
MQAAKRTPIIIALSIWAVINILLMALLILSGDVEDLNNYIEIALWTLTIPALFSGKKWGAAFAIAVLMYTLSTSVGILIYYQVWLNAVRLINIPAAILLFKALFDGKFK